MTRVLVGALVLACAGCGAAAIASTEAMATSGYAPEPGVASAPVAVEAVGVSGAGAEVPAAAVEASAEPAAGSGGALAAVVVRRGGGGDNEGPEALERAARRAPLLVYTAALAMQVEVEEIAATIDRIIEEAVQLGGYLASRDDRSVQVRIPSSHFREGLGAFEQLGDVTSRQVSAQDVTEEFHDLEVRLENLRAIRQRLESFLERAQNIEEVMRVHAELERVAREIDGIEGRLRFLRARVAFSLVTVSVSPRPVVAVVVEEEPTEPPPPPPPPPAQRPDLPVSWLGDMGIDRLMDLSQED